MLVITRSSFLLAELLEDLVEGVALALQVGGNQLGIGSFVEGDPGDLFGGNLAAVSSSLLLLLLLLWEEKQKLRRGCHHQER